MRKRFDFDAVDPPSLVERMGRALAGHPVKRLLRTLRVDALRVFDRASARAVTCLVAGAFFITALVLLVNAGLLGLLAIHVPPAAAYLGIGVLALLGGWLLIRVPSQKQESEDSS